MNGNRKSALLVAMLCFLISVVIIWPSGCGAGDEAAQEAPPQPTPEEVQDSGDEVAGVDGAEISRNMLVRKGELQLQVDDVDEASREVEQLTAEFNGFVAESSFSERNGETVARYMLRVPAAQFDVLITKLAELGRKTKRHTSAEDVSETYIDLEARLGVLKAQEKRLMELLAEASELDDILRLEEELFRVREPIERIQGRMEHLERQVAYSTLSLVLEPAREATRYPENVWEEFLFNFREGWRVFVSFITSVVGVLLYLWPFVLITAGVLYWRRKRKVRQANIPHAGKSDKDKDTNKE